MPQVDIDMGDQSDQDLTSLPASDFNGKRIRGCFCQQRIPGEAGWPKDIFPPGLVDVTFVDSNLDNIALQAGITLEGNCTNNDHVIQKDNQVWLLDGSGNPVEPIGKDHIVSEGGNVDPLQIPAIRRMTRTMRRALFDDEFENPTPKGRFYFKRKPNILDSFTRINRRGQSVDYVRVRGEAYLFRRKGGGFHG